MPRNSKQSSEKPGDLASDQRELSYYYDDAHGYEPYDPDAEDDDTDCETKNRAIKDGPENMIKKKPS